jgi:hypothetical protein
MVQVVTSCWVSPKCSATEVIHKIVHGLMKICKSLYIVGIQALWTGFSIFGLGVSDQE